MNFYDIFSFVCGVVSCCLLHIVPRLYLLVVCYCLLYCLHLFAMLFVIMCVILFFMISFMILFSFATWFLASGCFLLFVLACL